MIDIVAVGNKYDDDDDDDDGVIESTLKERSQSKIKLAIKHKTGPARLAQLLQRAPSLAAS